MEANATIVPNKLTICLEQMKMIKKNKNGKGGNQPNPKEDGFLRFFDLMERRVLRMGLFLLTLIAVYKLISGEVNSSATDWSVFSNTNSAPLVAGH